MFSAERITLPTTPAELLMKLLVPLKLTVTMLPDMATAPPATPGELLIKLLVPLKFKTVLLVKITPPLVPAELPRKLLVPLKLSTVGVLLEKTAMPPPCTQFLTVVTYI